MNKSLGSRAEGREEYLSSFGRIHNLIRPGSLACPNPGRGSSCFPLTGLHPVPSQPYKMFSRLYSKLTSASC